MVNDVPDPREVIANPQELVMTQAEAVPPPEETVPRTEDPHAPRSATGSATAQTLLEVKSLADRVGGLEKLREMVDVLLQMHH